MFLGVGYRTLVEHLCLSLKSITSDRAEELRIWATRLPKIRAAIAGQEARHVIVVDDAWESRPVDLVTGDVLLVPPEWSFEGDSLTSLGVALPAAWKPGTLIQAKQQGKSVLWTPDKRQLPVRVSAGLKGL